VPDRKTVRRIALALDGASEGESGEQIAYSVGGRGFAWTYMQRAAPKQPRVARPDVLAVTCPLDRKEMLIAAAPDIYFDDDHYRGYPAVLVRLDPIAERELAALLDAAWRCQRDKPPPRKRAKKKR
jgi:hypothetical protein